MSIFKSDALAGSSFLVTGGSSGIGRATATMIAACGGRVILTGRNAERLHETREALLGEGHMYAVFDMQEADATSDWLKSLAAQHGEFSGIFHAAGIELIRPVRMTKQKQLEDVFSSSLFSAFGIARAASQKSVLRDGSSLVFMSSVASSNGQIGMTAYSAAKAGVDGLVRSLACELAPRGIRVNSIAAGAVKTSMHDRLTKGNADSATSAYEDMHLLGFGEADDIAAAAVFLLADTGRWITGTNLVVDGGYKVR